MRWPGVVLTILFALIPARADQLAAGLSTDQVRITSSFRGADIVIFGAVAADARLGELGGRDIVVVLKGPEASIVVRRKERILGIWANAAEARIDGMPGYYHVAATRPLSQIASGNILRALALGAIQLRATVHADDAGAYRAAAIRAKTRARLYDERSGGVELLGPHLFRARMRLPAIVPPGQYRAEVYLFDKGRLIARTGADLPIGKAGLERQLYDLARDQPLPYALAAVFMALLLGWAGFLVFRQR
jgi:uncharacterized protein (TIGR02186 family)